MPAGADEGVLSLQLTAMYQPAQLSNHLTTHRVNKHQSDHDVFFCLLSRLSTALQAYVYFTASASVLSVNAFVVSLTSFNAFISVAF